ncbi:MAG: carbon-nitrogen hydrolase family protein, partial [Bdellovibrionales bacterium]|nr:carbon-nitrogen hydrolase family protein [Bdellovibrionales bacterium]
MKITIIEAPAAFICRDAYWNQLAEYLDTQASDVLVLNELPFGPWVSSRENYHEIDFEQSMRLHKEALESFDELGVETVVGSLPFLVNGKGINRSFVWRREYASLEFVHDKQFIPSHKGYHEARWFQPGSTKFGVSTIGEFRCAFLICTDVMFNEWARFYGRCGVDIIFVPRATNITTIDRWKSALSMAAIVSGAYVASSNRSGANDAGGSFGGSGMLFSPRGELVAETSHDEPMLSVSVDLSATRKAKEDYPCNVPDLVSQTFFQQFIQKEKNYDDT